MLADERYERILGLLREKGAATVAEFCAALGASEATVRRDLVHLDEGGQLTKVFGGAKAKGFQSVSKDDALQARMSVNLEEKRLIVQAAAQLVGPDDFVYLDAGSTTALLAESLTQPDAVYVTNGIAQAKELAARRFDVRLIGGRLKPVTEAVIGGQAVQDLQRFNFSIGFFGANGVTLDRGHTTPDPEEAMVKAQAVKQCQKAYVLADAAKVGQVSPVTFAAFGDAHLITSKLLDSSLRGHSGVTEAGR
ncbi:MAG: DeoR/GlpR family DNA-binding transcription regulator [Propionibacteriaceae bacterium]|nr:DeoR/GlpR family DNA-binding transcription regulator [Propionibacteriaceae bacterium]